LFTGKRKRILLKQKEKGKRGHNDRRGAKGEPRACTDWVEKDTTTGREKNLPLGGGKPSLPKKLSPPSSKMVCSAPRKKKKGGETPGAIPVWGRKGEKGPKEKIN